MPAADTTGPLLQVPPASAPLSSVVRSMLFPAQIDALESPPALGAAIGVPEQVQLVCQVSLVVQALPSSHAVPGTAGPLGTPKQSVQELLGTIPVVPPAHMPQLSRTAVPPHTPAQSWVQAMLPVVP